MDINQFNKDISTKLLRISEHCIPNKVVRIRPFETPWITSVIKRKIRARKRAYRKARIVNTPYYWDKFRRLRNDITNLIRESKNSYYENLSLKLKLPGLSSKGW